MKRSSSLATAVASSTPGIGNVTTGVLPSQVTDVLNKVTTGEADAGLVYVTDAQGAGDKVAAVPFPESADAVNTYPIAALEQSKDQELAGKFVDAVESCAMRRQLSVVVRESFGEP